MNDLGAEEVGQVHTSDGLLVIFRAYRWIHAISLRRCGHESCCSMRLFLMTIHHVLSAGKFYQKC
jgi:hypothetical protein